MPFVETVSKGRSSFDSSLLSGPSLNQGDWMEFYYHLQKIAKNLSPNCGYVALKENRSKTLNNNNEQLS